MRKFFAVSLMAVALLALSVASATANDASISIQDGASITLSQSEANNSGRNLSVMFGSQSGLGNVFVRCSVQAVAASGSITVESAQTQGSFEKARIATGVNVAYIKNDHPREGTDFDPGQFRNVALKVGFSNAEVGDEYRVACRLLQLTDDEDDGFAQSTLALSKTTITIR